MREMYYHQGEYENDKNALSPRRVLNMRQMYYHQGEYEHERNVLSPRKALTR
jgi:hypothetical protein